MELIYLFIVQGTLKGQLVGPLEFRGMNLTEKEFEYLLGKTGAIETSIKEDPKPKVGNKVTQRFLKKKSSVPLKVTLSIISINIYLSLKYTSLHCFFFFFTFLNNHLMICQANIGRL